MTRTFRLAAALAVACLAFLGMAGAAGAATYTGATMTLSSATVAPDGSLTVSGTNFLPSSPVTVTVASTPVVVGTPTTSATGAWSLTFAAPTEVGAHTVTATDGVNTLVVNFEVAAAAATTTGALPYTGTNSSLPMAQIGAGLLAAGAVIVFGVRKRNQHLTHARVDA